MKSAHPSVALVAAGLFLAACSQRAPSDSDGASPTATANPPSGKAQDRLVRAQSDGYRWVNRSAGIVHIPIERAMELIVDGKQSAGPAIDRDPIPAYRETNTAAQNQGRRLFVQFGCSVCHDPDSPSHAPSLVGIFGRRVRLSDGTFVIADEPYLRSSILHTKKQVVAGYVPVMPDYSSVIAGPDVQELVAYLKSLAPAPAP